MAAIFINPGSGPVSNATFDHAWQNMESLVKDADLNGARFERDPGGEDEGGRFAFLVHFDGRKATVDMPGIPLEHVRYTGAGDQNIWDFPRLYVNGSSWVWKFAVTRLSAEIRGEDE